MAEAGHELSGGGAGGGEGSGQVAEIVKVQALGSGRVGGRPELLRPVLGRDGRSLVAGEDHRVRLGVDVVGEVVVEDADQFVRDGDGASSGLRFGRPEHPPLAHDDLGLLFDGNRPVDQVDVAAFESGQLPGSQPGEGGGIDGRPVPVADRVGDSFHGLQRRDLSFGRTFVAGAFDHERVRHDETVGCGGHEYRPE